MESHGSSETLVAAQDFSETSCSQLNYSDDTYDERVRGSELSIPESLNYQMYNPDCMSINSNQRPGSSNAYGMSARDGYNPACSTPIHLHELDKFLDRSLSSILTSTSSLSIRGGRVSSSKVSFSPRARRGIVETARNRASTKKAEPVAYEVMLTTCSPTFSIADFSSCTWKIPIREKKFDNLRLDDKILIGFKSGLRLQDGRKIDILEGQMIAFDSTKKIGIVEHERLNFLFTGGSVNTTFYLVRKAYYEKKYHSVQVADYDKDHSIRLECILKVVQGASQELELRHIMMKLSESIVQDSPILIIGDRVRERIELSQRFCYLNLANLRPSNNTANGSMGNEEVEQLLREQHFELARNLRSDLRELEGLCDEFMQSGEHVDMKAQKVQHIFATLNRLEVQKGVLNEIDRRLMNEVSCDATIIYGTVQEVQDSQGLLQNLRPAAAIVLDADRLEIEELSIIFSVRRSYVYFVTDTPFFWENCLDFKNSKPNKQGLPAKKRGKLSTRFIDRIETFIPFDNIQVDFLSPRGLSAKPDFSLFLSCFKHSSEPPLKKATDNIVLLNHYKRGDDAKKLESDMIAGLRRAFAMNDCHDNISFFVGDKALQSYRDSALGESDSQLRTRLEQKKFRQYGSSFISLHGLTAGALENLYRLAFHTSHTFIMIGNVKELTKVDIHVEHFLNRLDSAGFIRPVLAILCPKHNCQILFGQKKNADPEIGCKEFCEKTLACGHKCAERCHPHDEYTFEEDWVKCKERCALTLPCGHPCLAGCGDVCMQRCEQLVRARLTCGHYAETECWEAENVLDGSHCLKEKCRRITDKKNRHAEGSSSSISKRGIFSKIFR